MRGPVTRRVDTGGRLGGLRLILQQVSLGVAVNLTSTREQPEARAHYAASQTAHHRLVGHILHQRLALGVVLPHLLGARLRHFLGHLHASGHRDTLIQRACHCCGTACTRHGGLNVVDAEPARCRANRAAKCARGHSGTQANQIGHGRINARFRRLVYTRTAGMGTLNQPGGNLSQTVHTSGRRGGT